MTILGVVGALALVVMVVVFGVAFYFWARFSEAKDYIELVLEGVIAESGHPVPHERCSACAIAADLGEGARCALKALKFWVEVEESRFPKGKTKSVREAAILYWQEMLADVERTTREDFPEFFEGGKLSTSGFQGSLFFNLVEHFMNERLEYAQHFLAQTDHTGFTAPRCILKKE